MRNKISTLYVRTKKYIHWQIFYKYNKNMLNIYIKKKKRENEKEKNV